MAFFCFYSNVVIELVEMTLSKSPLIETTDITTVVEFIETTVIETTDQLRWFRQAQPP
jgi:hypothetical protein